MGLSDSKLISKKIEKTIIKCPIETTEFISSDCESLCNSQFIQPNIFNVTNMNTLTSQQSINSISNLSFFNTDNCKSQDLKLSDISKKPVIKNLSSKIELLDTSLSDNNISLDEFSSSEQSLEGGAGIEDQSMESQSSECSASDQLKSENSASANTHSCFNKDFIHGFKKRYSNKSVPSLSKTKDKTDDKMLKIIDCEDSFTEITNMLPNDRNKSTLNNKESEINYVKDILLKTVKTDKDSEKSITNNSLALHEIYKDKQVRSVPISKVEMTNSLYSNFNHKMVNSFSAGINDCKPGFKCLCYKFWVDATYDTWKVFHNPRDRRIESIGRLSNCQIRLTKITQRSSKGMLKRQVYVYASSLSALEKCCKLFDDKFPYFCASSGLNIESST